ncbi:hypothetical protein K491DRAFT_697301 [Lophiostoma macrostomum CBS 122681]|uniref:RING-type domain-containing protein n=1 Tax=Lophiostoma macrostomum CBS 122681 TaxID=1314788 RepID=A0A6A6SVE6_9PLEO|nr:hypothetical protein K491DRAFT_697301 [Lophiostoma macrostomum CBS 122681]
MASVFSSIVRPARPPRPVSDGPSPMDPTTPPPCSYVAEPDLGELNAALQALTDIFPDIQPEVFREMLKSFSEQSRLEVITETLLKHDAKWVRGRYRMPAAHEEQRAVAHKYKYRTSAGQKDTRGIPLALEDTFRSRSYCEAAKEALYQEFKGVSHSTIKAVLAEYNWNYTHARPTLLALASKSWRSSITNFLLRRKPPSAKDHPLVVWANPRPQSGQPRTPLLVKTKSPELDKELYETLIAPELQRQRAEQIAQDQQLAIQWNEEEAEDAGEMYDCECCFIPYALEQMSTCDVDGHYICFRCIRHAISAALYDQGWARNIDTRFGTLRCIAPISNGVEDCTGCVPYPFIRRAFLQEKDGAEALQKLAERFSSEALLKSQLPLVRCPYCPYAEVDDSSSPDVNLFASVRLRRGPLLLASVPFLELLCFQVFRLALQVLVLLSLAVAMLNHFLPHPFQFLKPVHSALRQLHLRRRGLRFQCLSPSCGRASCLSCMAPWHDPHKCYSSQVQSLRLTLERATTDAVKRTCPNCNLGFVKSEGCNKLVCLCGYSMCYVCREGLAQEGYHHFCQHFRERPGSKCLECNKCDLYRTEDEDMVVKKAKETAERAWWDEQGAAAGEGLKRDVGKELRGWGKSSGFKSSGAFLEKLLDTFVV